VRHIVCIVIPCVIPDLRRRVQDLRSSVMLRSYQRLGTTNRQIPTNQRYVTSQKSEDLALYILCYKLVLHKAHVVCLA